MAERVLITSALPYANGPLHFGHIVGAYLPGDVYARFKRLIGDEVLYICGSDEYGVAITLAAEIAGRSPKEHVDIFHNLNKNFFKKLDFSFDFYSRTTSKVHTETTQEFFLDLYKGGYIEDKVAEQLYSEKEKRFLADRYVTGTCPKCGFEEARGDECTKCGASYEATDLKNPRSKLSGDTLILKPTKHWYLRFDKFKDKLSAWLLDKQWKPNVLAFAKNYVDDLHPRAITRDSSWGIPVPLKEAANKVLYVWFDAPIGYISMTKEWAIEQGNPDLWKKFWLEKDSKLVHFIGKDNIPFHTVFFPAMLMGRSSFYKLPDDVPANEFFLLEGKQFSKSDGWYIDTDDFLSRYSTDQVRYALAANAPETADSEFSFKDFQMRCNSELLGKLGNFVNRTLVFAKNHSYCLVPKAQNLSQHDKLFLKESSELVNEAYLAYTTFQLRKATQILMQLAQLGNTYFDFKKPWVLANDSASKDEMFTAIALCIECIKRLALIASPIMPAAAQKIWEMIGFKSELAKQNWEKVKDEPILEKQLLPEPILLFRKVEDEEIELQISKLKDRKFDPLKPQIEFDDFSKVDLRIGQITHAEAVPKSSKLLKLEVDIGPEKRQIVSGIAKSFTPQDLIGKRVVLIVNLKSVKIMGIESRGMILAVGDKEIELLFVQNAIPGKSVS